MYKYYSLLLSVLFLVSFSCNGMEYDSDGETVNFAPEEQADADIEQQQISGLLAENNYLKMLVDALNQNNLIKGQLNQSNQMNETIKSQLDQYKLTNETLQTAVTFLFNQNKMLTAQYENCKKIGLDLEKPDKKDASTQTTPARLSKTKLISKLTQRISKEEELQKTINNPEVLVTVPSNRLFFYVNDAKLRKREEEKRKKREDERQKQNAKKAKRQKRTVGTEPVSMNPFINMPSFPLTSVISNNDIPTELGENFEILEEGELFS